MVQLHLNAFHVVVFETFQVSFFLVRSSVLSQSGRVERHFILPQHFLDEGVVFLAVESRLEDSKYKESFDLQDDFPDRIRVESKEVDINPIQNLLEHYVIKS